jgi:hypothetical protein
MAATSNLPHLFGRFTAVMLGHKDIGRTLGQVRRMCATLAEPLHPSELQPERLIVQLRVELAEHFSVEEAPDYFGTVVDEAPWLAEEIAGLKAEHAAILSELEVLAEVARDTARWSALPQPILELIALLERHERSESGLLREMFLPGEQAR